MTCSTCGSEKELRPYGKGGAHICFACMMATPESEAEARRQFGARLETASKRTRAALLTPEGPVPLIRPGGSR